MAQQHSRREILIITQGTWQEQRIDHFCFVTADIYVRSIRISSTLNTFNEFRNRIFTRMSLNVNNDQKRFTYAFYVKNESRRRRTFNFQISDHGTFRTYWRTVGANAPEYANPLYLELVNL
ncbi:hypothetical protein HanPI659440_Chr01g0030541 [Helianthus annuus]|nr:hypothetical protein HanPI659440_Chr01g0030541 [Helianthus annuus]